MSFRKRPPKKQPTKEELKALQELEQVRRAAEAKGMTVEQYKAIEEMTSKAIRSPGSDKLPDNFKKMTDMPVSKGTAIPDPMTGEAAGYIDEIGDLRNMSGNLHPATEAWAKRRGLM